MFHTGHFSFLSSFSFAFFVFLFRDIIPALVFTFAIFALIFSRYAFFPDAFFARFLIFSFLFFRDDIMPLLSVYLFPLEFSSAFIDSSSFHAAEALIFLSRLLLMLFLFILRCFHSSLYFRVISRHFPSIRFFAFFTVFFMITPSLIFLLLMPLLRCHLWCWYSW